MSSVPHVARRSLSRNVDVLCTKSYPRSRARGSDGSVLLAQRRAAVELAGQHVPAKAVGDLFSDGSVDDVRGHLRASSVEPLPCYVRESGAIIQTRLSIVNNRQSAIGGLRVLKEPMATFRRCPQVLRQRSAYPLRTRPVLDPQVALCQAAAAMGRSRPEGSRNATSAAPMQRRNRRATSYS